MSISQIIGDRLIEFSQAQHTIVKMNYISIMWKCDDFICLNDDDEEHQGLYTGKLKTIYNSIYLKFKQKIKESNNFYISMDFQDGTLITSESIESVLKWKNINYFTPETDTNGGIDIDHISSRFNKEVPTLILNMERIC
tara:strand:- start:1034 stop:1450 length:417 start_codon:yes stop_codon:yes gene_type:complete